MTEDATAFIRRLIGAWDCCGTCAGGVLAARDRAVKAEALREAADAIEDAHAPWIESAAEAATWVRERADQEAFDAALTEVRTDYREALDRLGDE